MTAMHTDAPWAVVSDKGDDITVCAFDGDPKNGLMRDVICEITSSRDEADAALIAAAPEMLEALDWLLAAIEADPAKESHPGDREERLALACAAARNAMAMAMATVVANDA